MKKIVLYVFILISTMIISCTVDKKIEREISGKLLNISGPVSYDGIPCMMLTWKEQMQFTGRSLALIDIKNLLSGKANENPNPLDLNAHQYRTFTCYVFPIRVIPSEDYDKYINKDIKLKYTIRYTDPMILKLNSYQELS